MKIWFVCGLSMAFLTGCVGSTMNRLEEMPEDYKGAKVVYQGNGDGIAIGGGKGLHYERGF